MTRRLFYIALGAGVGIIAFRRITAAANKWTPTGIAAQAGNAGEQMASLWADVRKYSAEREIELRKALRIADAPDDRNSTDATSNRDGTR